MSSVSESVCSPWAETAPPSSLPLLRQEKAYETLKRALDILASGTALLILAPLFGLCALLIKLTDWGPVFFCQTRVGLNGQEFRCYKLRSMVPQADKLKQSLANMSHHADSRTFKITDDPRITWIGKWLRRTSLDELPQLLNVFLGDMSIVGPRPPVPSEVRLYTPLDRRRLDVRPGLTCIWQVSGRADIPFEQQVQLDIEYIEKRNLWLDLKLIIWTVPAVITGRGAY